MSTKNIFSTSRQLILLFSITILATSPAFSWFEEFRQSVRGKAMGNALSATWEGAEAMYYNPASLAHLRTLEVMGGFAQPAGGFSAFDDNSKISQFDASFVFPFNNPINLQKAGWRNDFLTTNAGFGLSFIQQGYDSGDGTAAVFQRYVGISYAKNLDNVLFQGARISFGITGNIYMLDFQGLDVQNNAAFKNKSSTAFTPDVGVIYNFSDFILLSLVMQNLIPVTVSPLENGEKLTGLTKLGLSWMFGSIGQMPFLQDILIVGEWRIASAPDQGANSTANIASSNSYHVGWESWYKIKNIVDIAGRAGFGVGDASYSEASAGLGFSRYFDRAKKYRFDLNFTWTWSNFASSLGSDHRYYFGGIFKYYFSDEQLPGRKLTAKTLEDLDQIPPAPAKEEPPKTDARGDKTKGKKKGK